MGRRGGGGAGLERVRRLRAPLARLEDDAELLEATLTFAKPRPEDSLNFGKDCGYAAGVSLPLFFSLIRSSINLTARFINATSRRCCSRAIFARQLYCIIPAARTRR